MLQPDRRSWIRRLEAGAGVGWHISDLRHARLAREQNPDAFAAQAEADGRESRMPTDVHGFTPAHPDQHVVEPETGKEMSGGEIVEVAPAELPHANRQFDLGYVLRGNVAPGYRGATELLTRVDDGEDFATDACILKDGFDADGHRYLEEISFEIKHTSSSRFRSGCHI